MASFSSTAGRSNASSAIAATGTSYQRGEVERRHQHAAGGFEGAAAADPDGADVLPVDPGLVDCAATEIEQPDELRVRPSLGSLGTTTNE